MYPSVSWLIILIYTRVHSNIHACMFKERVFRNTSSIHRVAYYYADYGLFLRVIFYLLRNFISSCHPLLVYIYTFLAAFQSFRLSES